MWIFVVLLALAGVFFLVSVIMTILKWLSIVALILVVLAIANFFRQRRRN
ncbi:MAG: hypothetical protein QOF57_898 [Frankiaceae bacterium]|jgi:uncharacterized membrane protein|nr:hypothetical protein [Frankiaceae bacterium]MDQ1727594.1 hypothetical protein [Frankiaceae bacterium]